MKEPNSRLEALLQRAAVHGFLDLGSKLSGLGIFDFLFEAPFRPYSKPSRGLRVWSLGVRSFSPKSRLGESLKPGPEVASQVTPNPRILPNHLVVRGSSGNEGVTFSSMISRTVGLLSPQVVKGYSLYS